MTITLLDAEPGETFTLTIANDTAATTGRIKNFVDQYNALAKTIAALRSYEPATKKAGPLLGDAMLRGIEGELRTKLTDTVSGLTGSYQSLASIGITTEKDGTLKLDAAKLNAAMTSNYDGVAALFGSDHRRGRAPVRCADAAPGDRRRARRARQAPEREERRTAEDAGGARGPHAQGGSALSRAVHRARQPAVEAAERVLIPDAAARVRIAKDRRRSD